ncbi:aminotransferase class I/II-fold pyridoxal phosphate-dependent enzyme [Patescibacteria group bacterium]|nr:aminotransferase class I/II-fold pyridoxal phosphate-dependent enzyme [Patescibacteria group bacterium]
MIKPISISLSPNTEADDIWLAFGLLFQPWKWKKGKELGELEKEFKGIAFNSGRSAFMAILDALDLQEDPPSQSYGEARDEVLLQAFTCNAVPNPVQWSGLKPVYVDCNEDDYNIDVEDLKRKITPQSKVVVVQHTFGIPADMDRVMEICKQQNLILIEDCAHALGAEYKGKKVGTFGKAAFFSFSRDKVISSVYGGMVTTNDTALEEKVKAFQEKSGNPSYVWILQQLLHPVLMNWLVLPTYQVFGKYVLVILQQLHILSKAVHWKEKRGMRPEYFPKAFPNALAVLLQKQMTKLERFNEHRKQLASYYAKELNISKGEGIFLRFPVQYENAREILRKAWKNNILLGDWYTTPVAPHDTKLNLVQYKEGSCPKAERLGKMILNLPTHINISEKEAEKVVKFIKLNAK